VHHRGAHRIGVSWRRSLDWVPLSVSPGGVHFRLSPGGDSLEDVSRRGYTGGPLEGVPLQEPLVGASALLGVPWRWIPVRGPLEVNQWRGSYLGVSLRVSIGGVPWMASPGGVPGWGPLEVILWRSVGGGPLDAIPWRFPLDVFLLRESPELGPLEGIRGGFHWGESAEGGPFGFPAVVERKRVPMRGPLEGVPSRRTPGACPLEEYPRCSPVGVP
jgi:hypothetical protein